MRSDWQTHCLVITVWWTLIVFRLVETETCCALACSTNANLFHVDIISHCLLSNHNTCLTFFVQWKCFAHSLFYLCTKEGRGELWGHREDLLVINSARLEAWLIIYIFLKICTSGDVKWNRKREERGIHEEVKAVITCLVFSEERSEILFFLLAYRHSITAKMSVSILRTG